MSDLIVFSADRSVTLTFQWIITQAHLTLGSIGCLNIPKLTVLSHVIVSQLARNKMGATSCIATVKMRESFSPSSGPWCVY